MAQQIGYGLPQAGVRLGFLLRQLCFEPALQLVHDRSTVLLMKGQPLGGAQLAFARLRVVALDAA